MSVATNPIIKWLTNVRDIGLEYASRRYYALYPGEIVDVEDTQQQARARVKVAALGIGELRPDKTFDPTPIPRRALPSSIYAGPDHGIYFPPEAGDAAWVAFDLGDANKPRYIGSYWRNRDPSRSATSSEVPNEFKSLEGAPTKRGIKTGYGHGMIFCDDSSAPYVALWNGEQQTPGQDALRKHQITLSESDSAPTVKGVTQTVGKGIYANTLYGHFFGMNDTEKSVTLSGLRADPGGETANSIKLDDKTNNIKIKTRGQQSIEIADQAGQIVVTGTGVINVIAAGAANVTAGGVINLAATGGISQAGGAGPPVVAAPPGASVETGAGAKIINFLGAVTETVGSFVQNAASVIINAPIYTVNTALATIGPLPGFGITVLSLPVPLVIIGDINAAKQLLTADLLDWLENHTHVGNMGAPTPLTPADALLLHDPLNPADPNPAFVSNSLVS